MHLLKQSTAATVLVGPVLDSTGASYASAVIGDFSITKNGTVAALASAATATHDHNGHYLIVLTTGNTDTLGRAAITCNKATYAMPPSRFSVLPAATFDAIITNAAGATGGLQFVGSNAATTFATLTVTGAFSINGTSDVAQTGDTFPVVNHATYGNAKLVRATTPANTLDVSAGGEAGVDWANVGSPTSTLVLSGTTVGTATTTGSATLAASQPNYAPSKAGDAMTLTSGERASVATQVEVQVIDETDTNHVLAAIVNKINSVDTDLSGLSIAAIASATTTAVWAAVTRTLTASQSFNNAGQTTALPANVVDVAGLTASVVDNPPTLPEIVNGVWDEPKSAHTVTGSFGLYLDAAVSSRSTYAGGPVAVSDKTGFSLAASGLDAVTVETGVNARQALALVMDAAGSGVLTGAATTTVTVKNPAGSASRIVATVDSSGNRSAVTLTPPA